MNFKKSLREGLLTNNPVLSQLLGMCSTMAITTTLFNGLGMGLSVTLILICSNVVISLLRKIIPGKIRIAAYIVIIAGFVTVVQMIIQAEFPELYEMLGTEQKEKIEKAVSGYKEKNTSKEILFIRAATSAKHTKAKRSEDHFACAMLDELGLFYYNVGSYRNF